MIGPNHPLIATSTTICHPGYCGQLKRERTGDLVWHCGHAHPSSDAAVACAETERPYQQMLLNVPDDSLPNIGRGR